MKEIEQELRAALPDLSFYFDTVFGWMKETNQAALFKSMSLQTGKTERSLTYAFLLGQVAEQIKIGGNKKLSSVWEYLFNKLAESNYFSAERAKELRAEMEPYL